MGRNLTVWIEAVILGAAAMVISFIPTYIGPLGIDISLGMVPIVLLGLRRGTLPGVAAGFVWGLLSIMFGTAFIFSPVQTFIEYFIAFAFGGFAGLLMPPLQRSLNKERSKPIKWMVTATIIGVFARFFWHFIAGIIFFGANAPAGTPVWIFSLIVNGASAILTSLAVILILILIYRTAPRLFKIQR